MRCFTNNFLKQSSNLVCMLNKRRFVGIIDQSKLLFFNSTWDPIDVKHYTKCFCFRKVHALSFQTQCFTSATSFFSKKNLHQKIIEKNWKNWKLHVFLLFSWKSWKFISLWIFVIFIESWKCNTRKSFDSKYMILSAFESSWCILYKKNKQVTLSWLTLLIRGIEDTMKSWKIEIFIKFHNFWKISKKVLPQW